MADGGAIRSNDPGYSVFDQVPPLAPASSPVAPATPPATAPPASATTDPAATVQTDIKNDAADKAKQDIIDASNRTRERIANADRQLNGIPIPQIQMPQFTPPPKTTPAQAWGSSA